MRPTTPEEDMRAERAAFDETAPGPPTPADPLGLVALVREWQAARKPVGLEAPGVGVAEAYQAAVKRMAAADVALAAFNLDGPAGGALVGQTAPTESTGTSLRDELTEIIRWRFRTGDGAIMDGHKMLADAQRIADEIAPYIEEAVGER